MHPVNRTWGEQPHNQVEADPGCPAPGVQLSTPGLRESPQAGSSVRGRVPTGSGRVRWRAASAVLGTTTRRPAQRSGAAASVESPVTISRPALMPGAAEAVEATSTTSVTARSGRASQLLVAMDFPGTPSTSRWPGSKVRDARGPGWPRPGSSKGVHPVADVRMHIDNLGSDRSRPVCAGAPSIATVVVDVGAVHCGGIWSSWQGCLGRPPEQRHERWER